MASHFERNGFFKAQDHSMIIILSISTSSKLGFQRHCAVILIGLSQVRRTIANSSLYERDEVNLWLFE